MSALDRLLEFSCHCGDCDECELNEAGLEELAQLRNRIAELENTSKSDLGLINSIIAVKNSRIAELEAEHTEEVSVKLKLREIIAELEARTTWQPIETAPKDGTEILVLEREKKDISYVAYYSKFEGWTVPYDEVDPTHWMPLPEPPK
jgi:hypothetical protein